MALNDRYVLPGASRKSAHLTFFGLSTIRILNMEDGSSETLPHHSDYVYHVAVDDANDVISCGEDQIVAYWNREHIRPSHTGML